MEGEMDMNSGGVAVRGNDAPDSFRVAARLSTDNNPPSTTHPEVALQPAANIGVTAPTYIPAAAAATAATTSAVVISYANAYGGTQVKKKRGRPRKYAPDGSAPAAATLSPMPISASIPLAGGGEFSGWKQQARVKPFQAIKKAHKVEIECPGDKMAFMMGGNFTPHVITVLAGEDVAMKILSFSQQESRAICVLSASGSISNVTLRQPNSSGGTLTYEGRFEILSLSGSFMPTENGLLKSRSGGMSVSLAGPDGQVLGGGLAGLLVASSPVQVVLGSFSPSRHLEPRQRKQRMEPTSAPSHLTAPYTTTTIHHQEPTAQWGGGGSVVGGGSTGYGGGVQNLNFSSPPPVVNHNTDPFPASTYSTHNYRDVETDNVSSSEDGDGESDDDSGSKFEISG